MFVLLAATVFVFDKIGFAVQQEKGMASFHLSFRFPSRFTFDERTEYFKQVEKKLNERKDYYELDGFIVFYSTWFGQLEGWFARDRKGTVPAREVAEQIYNELPKIPGLKIDYQQFGEGEEKQDKKEQHYIRLSGQDPEQLDALADELKPLFRNIPGVIALNEREDETPNELALLVDRDRASSIGVNPTTLAGVVGYALRGSTLPRFNSDGRQIPVRIRYSEEDRTELADLNNFLVPTEDGRFSSIGTLTRPAMLNSPRYISRTDKRVSYTIGLELESGKEEETRKAIEAVKRNIDLPEGITFSEVRRRFDMEEIFNGVFALVLAIVFIYLLMAFLFESVMMPLSIVLTIPLAAIGSVWIHLIAGKEMDFLGIIGCVLLVGVVVNNGIVLDRLRQPPPPIRDGTDAGPAQGRRAPFPPDRHHRPDHHHRHDPADPQRVQRNGHELQKLWPDPHWRHGLGHPPHPPRRPRVLHPVRRRPTGRPQHPGQRHPPPSQARHSQITPAPLGQAQGKSPKKGLSRLVFRVRSAAPFS